MSSSRMSPDCVAFARNLADHLDASRAGEQPAHAAACGACARRLRLAAGLGGLAAARPQAPAELARPQFLHSLFEKIVDEAEASPLGEGLAAAMRVEPMGDRLPWPVQSLQHGLEEHVAAAGSHTPPWIRPAVAVGSGSGGMDAGRRIGVGRGVAIASTVAASIALFVVFGWRAGRSEGTNADLRIVFVPVSELPAVMHPTAVLRQAVIR